MRRLLAILLLGLPLCLQSQEDGFLQRKDVSYEIPRWTLKTNISTAINPYKTALALGADIRVLPRMSVDLSAGYIPYSYQFVRFLDESYRGGRYRAGFKYYLGVEHALMNHVGLELKYNDVTHWYWRNLRRQGQQFTEWMKLKREVQSWGAAARFGIHWFWGANRQFMLEGYTGLGVARHYVSIDMPPDGELALNPLGNPVRSIFEYPRGWSTRIDFLLGLQFGIALW